MGPFVALTDPLELDLGLDGIEVARGDRHALLLPEVAGEHGLDREGLLEAACRKAGLAADAWRLAGTDVLAFRTRRFGGPAIPEPD